MPNVTALILFLAAMAAVSDPVLAADAPILTIRDHQFEPAEIDLAAGQRITLTVTNADATPEEFESRALHIEKIVPGGQSAKIRLGPLEPGTYDFFGDMHSDSAKGAIVVK